MKIYSVQFRYNHCKFGPEVRTIRVRATSPSAAIGRATRVLLNRLDRKEQYDTKRLAVTAIYEDESCKLV